VGSKASPNTIKELEAGVTCNRIKKHNRKGKSRYFPRETRIPNPPFERSPLRILAVFDKAANHLPKRGSKTKNGNPAPYHIVIISFFFLLKKRDGTTGACVARIGFEISCKCEKFFHF
jgi:hypothetical protein